MYIFTYKSCCGSFECRN